MNKDLGTIIIHDGPKQNTQVPKVDPIADSVLECDNFSVVEWLNHLREELISAVNYIEKVKALLENKK